MIGRFVTLAGIDLDTYDLGNDFSSFLDHHVVTDADVLPSNFIGIVQASRLHRGPGQKHGLDMIARRDLRHKEPRMRRPLPHSFAVITCRMVFERRR